MDKDISPLLANILVGKIRKQKQLRYVIWKILWEWFEK